MDVLLRTLHSYKIVVVKSMVIEFANEIWVFNSFLSFVELFLKGVIVIDPSLLGYGFKCQHMPDKLLFLFVLLLEIWFECVTGLLEEKIEVIPVYVVVLAGLVNILE